MSRGLGIETGSTEEALALLDTLLPTQKLQDIQEVVFCYSWQGWTYPEIAEHTCYDTSYIRDVGSKLWKKLSQGLGEPVKKKNLHAVFRRQVYPTSPKLSRFSPE